MCLRNNWGQECCKGCNEGMYGCRSTQENPKRRTDQHTTLRYVNPQPISQHHNTSRHHHGNKTILRLPAKSFPANSLYPFWIYDIFLCLKFASPPRPQNLSLANPHEVVIKPATVKKKKKKYNNYLNDQEIRTINIF